MNHFYKLLVFILLLLPLFSFGQSHFKPGYIVTTVGDTVHGFVNLKEWRNSPHAIEFKTTSGIKSYKAADIRAFGVLNINYYRYSGRISTDATDVSRLSTGRDTSYKLDTIFLQIIQRGPNVTLYVHNDDTKTRYFISEHQHESPYELIYRIYHIPERGNETHTENVFVSQLYVLAEKYNPGSAELRSLIEKARYNSTDIKDIALGINKTSVDTKNYGTNSSVRFFAGAGISVTHLKPTGDFPFSDPPSRTNLNPTLSGGANIYINPNVGQFVLRGEILLTRNSYNTVANIYFNQPEKPKGQYRLTQYIIAIYPQMVFNAYNTNNFKFYLDAGLALNFSKNNGDELYNAYTQVTEKHALNISSYWITYPFKAGIVVNKKIDISVAYVLSTSINNNITSGSAANGNYSLNLSGVMAGLHYNF